MKKRFIISGFLTLIFSIVPFFLVSIEVKPGISSSNVVQENYYDNIKEISDSKYGDVDKEKLTINRDIGYGDEKDN